jgi:hypothetical protein
MVSLAARTVALVPFPFSDLSGSKYRPVLVLAEAGRGDFVLAYARRHGIDNKRSHRRCCLCLLSLDRGRAS